VRHPPEIIESAQAQLGDGVVDVGAVLQHARSEFERYFRHRPAPEIPSQFDNDPERTRNEIERMVCGILLGVMTRAAVFEALGRRSQPPVEELGGPVDYTTTYVDEYDTHDGEHQFMEAIVRELDAGLLRFYRRPRATALRIALRDASRRLHDPAPDDHDFDVWTIEADELFRRDSVDVADRVRRTLRHNAETAMLFVRIFPASVAAGFEEAGVAVPTLTAADLQSMFLDAVPTLRISASSRLKNGISPDPRARHLRPMSHEELEVTVHDGHTITTQWRYRNLSRTRRGGRCPANSPLPALSPEERQILRFSNADTTMSTAEALLRLAGLLAPAMWCHQYEANLLCADFPHHTAARRIAAAPQHESNKRWTT
jgi:hypothetical protein